MTTNNHNAFKVPYILVILFMLPACHQEPEEVAAPRPVWVMTVENATSSVNSRYTGVVKSRYESNVGFRINGKIVQRLVNVGDVVRKGQVLAKLDASDTQLNASSAQADVQAAQANLALAKAELERRQQLYRQQFISRSALDSYETQLKTAQARLQQAQSQAAVSQHQTAYTQLLADRAGVVGMITAEPGQVVATGQTIAQIYDLNALEVQVSVPETVIDQLHPGDDAKIQLVENARYDRGRIREISPAANSQTHAFDLRVQLLDTNPQVKLGMTAQVQFSQAGHAQSSHYIIVPSTAITRQGKDTAVWVIDTQQRAHLRKVTTGPITEAGIPVISGLQVQERIATIGVHTLAEGMQVQAVTPAAEVLR
ncbi:efflux RND transporter periplasmic adaptor subunit [Methylophilus aquaticus]|uniref:Efflux RND transporter periplasmic adaptor subunit n=1 Tax=Methylophilus aquaticus TaxID=1971610 RepID=A0ABT9JPF2_9PROT|nr:efflux RND transporter periplasmic adaptor subunit [Methylophilus aquaticus]MDP8566443.1 efflux RND transporter periplasmic adaptor subunit [Methylophilus aquaticus]